MLFYDYSKNQLANQPKSNQLFLEQSSFIIQKVKAIMGCGASINIQPSVQPIPSPQQKKPSNKIPEIGFPSSQVFKPELKLVHSLIQQKKWKQVIEKLQEYIKANFDKDLSIDGLGNYQGALGYYECFPYTFYLQGIKSGKYIGTAIDLLNLAYMVLRLDDYILLDGLQFYQNMIDDFEDSWQLIFSIAIVASNNGYYDQAIEYYKKVIDLRPNFTPCFENIALIYEYKRIQASKSMEWATKALKVDPNNMYGSFILAKKEKGIDQRILKVKKVAEKFPKYARAINYVGVIYSETKKASQQAIVWHKKAVEAIPMFDIGNYNIGLRFEEMKDYQKAIYYYLQANRFDKDYELPTNKLASIFILLKYTEGQIQEVLKQHSDVRTDYVLYKLGKAYFDLGNPEMSLKFFAKAEKEAKNELKSQIEILYNSIANTYIHMKRYNEAIEYLNKGIMLNPKFVMLYFNLGVTYKNMNKVDQAKKYYNKCIQVNHRYAPPYNNLANIFVEEKNYDEAIKCFKKAVKNKSNYVLAMANLGITYLKIQNFREAFRAISRAKELLQTNKKDLSPGNLVFLTETLQQFDKQGQNWRKSGGITQQTRKKLNQLIKSFQSNFSRLYDEGKQKVNIQKVLKKQVIEIIRLIADSKFYMSSIDSIYELVKKIFQDNEEYFHIVPLLFIQYFYQKVFVVKTPILETQKQLFATTQRLSKKTLEMIGSGKQKTSKKNKLKDFKLIHFDPPNDFKVNLFKNAAFFNDYAEIYNEILEINKQAEDCYKEYKDMVSKITSQSKGIPYGIGMKIPKSQQQQFKVILRIFQKMFKNQLTADKVSKIIEGIEKGLKQEEKKQKLALHDVVRVIMNTWTSEITNIVRQRKLQNKATEFGVTDLLRAKIMFENIDYLKKALTLVDQACFRNGYKIVEMDNRLDKEQTQDVALKIQIKESVCELQLAMEQDESQYHFIHSIYEIERSPLGCIFGSYIFMSKRFNYPLIQNCKDIVEHLKDSEKEEDKKTVTAARYIIENMFL